MKANKMRKKNYVKPKTEMNSKYTSMKVSVINNNRLVVGIVCIGTQIAQCAINGPLFSLYFPIHFKAIF